MRRFGRRHKRRSTVRWLPDTSWMSSWATHMFNKADPSSLTWGTEAYLIEEAGEAPANLQTALTGLATGRLSPAMDTLIVDHIKGKVAWTIDGAGTVEPAVPDADGWGTMVIRSAICIVERPTANGGGTAVGVIPSVTSGGTTESFTTSSLLDPGGVIPVMLQGSSNTDGFRCLWRRSWLYKIKFGSGYVNTMPHCSEVTCPPGPYVDIKPKRILRPNETLQLGWFSQFVPDGPFTGGFHMTVSHDLRTAAHNTTRRR